MKNDNLKIALIGLGYWGKNLARNLHELNVLDAICDNDINNLGLAPHFIHIHYVYMIIL